MVVWSFDEKTMTPISSKGYWGISLKKGYMDVFFEERIPKEEYVTMRQLGFKNTDKHFYRDFNGNHAVWLEKWFGAPTPLEFDWDEIADLRQEKRNKRVLKLKGISKLHSDRLWNSIHMMAGTPVLKNYHANGKHHHSYHRHIKALAKQDKDLEKSVLANMEAERLADKKIQKFNPEPKYAFNQIKTHTATVLKMANRIKKGDRAAYWWATYSQMRIDLFRPFAKVEKEDISLEVKVGQYFYDKRGEMRVLRINKDTASVQRRHPWMVTESIPLAWFKAEYLLDRVHEPITASHLRVGMHLKSGHSTYTIIGWEVTKKGDLKKIKVRTQERNYQWEREYDLTPIDYELGDLIDPEGPIIQDKLF